MERMERGNAVGGNVNENSRNSSVVNSGRRIINNNHYANNANGVTNQPIGGPSNFGLRSATSLRILSNALLITHNIKRKQNRVANGKANIASREGSDFTPTRITNTMNTPSNFNSFADAACSDTGNDKEGASNRQITVNGAASDTDSTTNATDGTMNGEENNGSGNVVRQQFESNSGADDTGDGRKDAKRQKVSHDIDDNPSRDRKPSSSRCYHPSSFVTWNCNGFGTRAKHDRDQLRRLVSETQTPDLICIQEARLNAAGPGELRGRPIDDKDHIRTALREAFGQYTPFWSLADKKYAGTLTLVRNTCLEDGGSSPSENNTRAYDPDLVAFSPRSAIDLILRRLGTTRSECGLDAEPSVPRPTAAQKPKKQQTSLTLYFAPKKKNRAAATTKRKDHDHNPEGRFQFFFFPGMDVVQTYVPNNGTKEESFRRRREWDRSMKKFVMERNQVLKAISSKNCQKGSSKSSGEGIDSGLDRKLLWSGDMNVAADYRDGSHWEKRGSERGGGDNRDGKDSGDESENCDVYEWFRDEPKCLGKAETGPPKLPENVGIPGFTPAERERFAEFVRVGDFCDVWRKLHPKGAVSEKNDSPWEGPSFTWRGTVAKNFAGFAKYQGKGQRIDYFLLSPSKLGSTDIEKCEIRGYGTHREGLFCRSDHCAVELRLNHS